MLDFIIAISLVGIAAVIVGSVYVIVRDMRRREVLESLRQDHPDIAHTFR